MVNACCIDTGTPLSTLLHSLWRASQDRPPGGEMVVVTRTAPATEEVEGLLDFFLASRWRDEASVPARAGVEIDTCKSGSH